MLLIGVGVCSVGYFFAGLALIETFCMLPNGFSNTVVFLNLPMVLLE